MYLYHTRDERMAFEAGYYKGTIEINRAREARRECTQQKQGSTQKGD